MNQTKYISGMNRHIMTCVAVLAGMLYAQAESVSVGALVMEKGQTASTTIGLTNSNTSLVSFQMDLVLPDGITINKSGCSLTSRFDSNQELTIGKQSDGVYRLTSTSLSLTPISGTSGAIITLSLTASQTAMATTATIQNILLATSNSERITCSDVTFDITVTPDQEYTDGQGVIYTLNNDGQTYRVSGHTDAYTGEITIPSTVNGCSVTSIGNYAFNNCISLTSVVIPEGVTYIGENAFSNSGIYSIVIPYGVTSIEQNVFNGCPNLESVMIPNSVKNIKSGSFNRCPLLSITIPSSVISISKDAFFCCQDLSSITVESGNSVYDSRNNCNAIVVTANNTLLTGCKNTTIPNSVERIGNDSFRNLSGLKSVIIPSSVTSIGDEAFKFSGLTSVTIMSSEIAIGEDAFKSCQNLSQVFLYVRTPTNVSLGRKAFYEIDDNAVLKVPYGCKDLYLAADGWSDFESIVEFTIDQEYTDAQGVIYTLNADGQTYTVSGHTDACSGAITIPATVNGCSVTSIGEAFGWSCEDLTDVTIPSSVTSIGGGAFFSCSSLVNINLPEGLTVIDEGTFYDCTSLQKITIPSTVTRLGIQAFTGCPFRTLTIPASVQVFDEASLIVSENTIIIMQSSTPPSITQYVLEDALGMQVFSNIIVPDGSKSAYQNANVWNRYSDKIIEVSEAGGILSEEVTIDQVRYKLNYENYTAEVISKADKYSGDVVIPTIVVNERNTYNVTSIGYQAFLDCTGLTSVSIPNSVTSIAGAAFRNCDNLTSVIVDIETPLEIAENVYTNRANATLYVPEGSVSAYSAANYWKEFNRIEAIVVDSPEQEVTDGHGVKYTLNADGQTYTVSGHTNACTGDIVIPSIVNGCSVTYIDQSAFEGCHNMSSVIIPSSVTTISQFAFKDCQDLTSLTIPNSVKCIDHNVFTGCYGLTSVTIPNSVTSIGIGAFSGCYGLTSIIVDEENPIYDSRDNCNAIIETASNTLIAGCKNTVIPNSVTSIGVEAFRRCRNMSSIIIPTSVTSIGSVAFCECDALASLTIPNSVMSIGWQAFGGCDGLTSVTIPKSVTSIGIGAFSGCYGLTSIIVDEVNPIYDSRDNCNAIIETASNTLIAGCKNTAIPNSVTSIGTEAFYGCDNMSSVIIPSNVTSIGQYAFFGVTGLVDLYCYAEDVPSSDAEAFLLVNLGNVTLYVPSGSIEAYSAVEPWNGFKEIVAIADQSVSDLFKGSYLWASYVAEEDLAVPTGLTAYVITDMDNSSAIASQITYIPQGVPVLLKRDDATINSYTFTSGTGTPPTTNLLKAYTEDKTVANREGYVLFRDEFVLVSEGTLPAGKVFLPVYGSDRSGVAYARGIVVRGGGLTDIDDMRVDSDQSDEVWYDLQGRKLEKKPTKKGVYILNGRKMIVK